jgi:[ribosomal protein S5]-alanine N-acetyltransferase
MSVMQTARLVLRELSFDDAPFILELLNDSGFLRYIGDKGVRNLADACEYIANGPMASYVHNGFGLYATCLRDGPAVGICGLVKREGLSDPDVGFAFLSRYWSKGYAVESAAAVMAFARDALNLDRILAITSTDNLNSIAVLEKIGLKFERMVQLAHGASELKLFASEPQEKQS